MNFCAGFRPGGCRRRGEEEVGGEEEGTAVDMSTDQRAEGASGSSASAHRAETSATSGSHGGLGEDEWEGRRGDGAAVGEVNSPGDGHGGDSWSCELESGAFHRQAFSLQVDAGALGFQATNTPRIDRLVSGPLKIWILG